MEIIFQYTRADAIRDGILIDVTDAAKESGFVIPVAVTEAIWNTYIIPSEQAIEEGQSETGRLHDLLWMLYVAIHSGGSDGSKIRFPVIFDTDIVVLKALCHGGDQGEPVITVMLPHED